MNLTLGTPCLVLQGITGCLFEVVCGAGNNGHFAELLILDEGTVVAVSKRSSLLTVANMGSILWFGRLCSVQQNIVYLF